MEGVTIRLAVGIESQLGDRNHEDWRATRPLLIVFTEATQEARMLGYVLFSGHDKVPGLLIGCGSCPPRRLPEAQQLLGLDRTLGESTRAPALSQQCLDGIGRVSRFLHPQCLLPVKSSRAFDATTVC